MDPSDPKFIRLFDISGTKVIDSVSTDYEDSFCLDAFGDLIKQHHSLTCAPPKNLKEGEEPPPVKQRAFILARVQTWDHKQPDKAFYSYYNAFHLNKLLFQTQVYLGKKLIHRIHVLNPLTNTDIIGNVLYFIARPRADGKDGLTPSLKPDPLSAPAAPGGSNIARTAPLIDSPTHPQPIPTPEKSLPSRPTSSKFIPGKINTSRIPNHPSGPTSAPAAASIDPMTPQTWTMKMQAVTELKEDGETSPTGPRKSSLSPGSLPPLGLKNAMRRMSNQVSRRMSLSPSRGGGASSGTYSPPSTSAPEASLLHTTQEKKQGRSFSLGNRSRPSPDSLSTTPAAAGHTAIASGSSGPKAGVQRRKTISQVQVHNVHASVKSPDGPIVINSHRSASAKVEIPAGTLTRFGVPVPASEIEAETPRTPPRRRRGMSLSNAGMDGGFAAWAAVQVNTPSPTRGAPAILEEDEEAAAAATATPDAVSGQAAAAASAPNAAAEPAAPMDPESIPAYDMVLFATDNDFLEQSKIRALFRENACAPEDAQLFEMPPVTSEGSPTSASPSGQDASQLTQVVFADDDALCEMCYPSPERIATMSPAWQTFHNCKCYFLALAFAFGIIFFVLMSLRNSASPATVPGTPNAGAG
ncbi:hypothetical protein BCR44DRAFT_55719 [Catenaria anguillulae PL171]|uniref:Uncharacterized protein n=1 Tax=Catenaria anguillulae PL171 TaxID=765915 RepID=A0A1Y2H851_9FUNG|nr:hypothetical protein BCR44DRAFT_55719 [Catenaria anguillulae PL171]